MKPVIDWMSKSFEVWRIDFVWDRYSDNSLKSKEEKERVID